MSNLKQIGKEIVTPKKKYKIKFRRGKFKRGKGKKRRSIFNFNSEEVL